MSRLVRNPLFGTLAGIGTTRGDFLSSLMVSRALSVEQAGSMAFAIWLVWLETAVIKLGIPFTLARSLREALRALPFPLARRAEPIAAFMLG